MSDGEPTAEVVRSQFAMLGRSGKAPQLEPDEVARRMETQVGHLLRALGASRQVELLVIDYPSLVADPAPQVARIAEFLGKERLPHPDRMASAVDGSLRRQKG